MELMTDRRQMKPMDKLTKEEDILRAFKQAIAESREAMSGEVSENDRNWKYYFGQHYLRNTGGRWIQDTSGDDKLRLQQDIIQLAVDALRPVLVKLRPHILALATYPDEDAVLEVGDKLHTVRGLKNSDVATFATQALMTEHRRRHEEIMLAEMTLDVMITGQAYRCLLPVDRPRFGTMIEPKLYPRARVGLDPKGTRLADFVDFKWVWFEDELDASEIYQIYGLREREYTNTEHHTSDDMIRDYDEGGLFRGVTEFRRFGRSQQVSRHYERRVYKVHTGYFNDAGAEVVTYHEKTKALNYPWGRQIVMINEQKLAVDKRNPNWHGDYPLTCYQSLPLPHIARALNDVGKLKDMQKGVNLLVNALVGTAMLNANPKLFYEEGAFNPNDWQAGPGGMVRFEPGALAGNRVSWFQPSGADRGSYNLYQDIRHYGKEEMAGVTPALQGQQAPAGSSGVLYNSEQSASMVGPTFRIEMMDAGHHRYGRQELEMMQQYADFRDPYYAEMHDIEKHHPSMAEAFRDLMFKVEYESRAELPHNPIARHNLYWNQFVEGVIDFEQYILNANVQMRPELRELARKGSLERYMPGVPREVALQILMQQAQAQAQMETAQQNAAGLNAQAGGGGSPPMLEGGERTPIASESGEQGIAGDPDQRAL